MSINQNSGQIIPLPEAQEYVQEYRNRFPENIKAFFVGIEKVNDIISQDNCIGIRMYNGFDTKKNKANLVLVGVDTNHKDMTDGIIVERLVTCPHTCDDSSALNY